jgi:nitrate/nitrite transport system permease protein
MTTTLLPDVPDLPEVAATPSPANTSREPAGRGGPAAPAAPAASIELVAPDVVLPGRIRPRAERLGFAVLGFVILGLAWHFASTRAEGLPGPVPTLSTLRSLLADGFAKDGPAGQGILLQLRDSLVRVAKGFGLAACFGVPAGFAIGTNRRLHQTFDPIVQLLRPISPLAWFPIWLTIFVTAEPSAIAVIFVASIWPIILNTAAGAGAVPHDQLDVARVFRFSTAARIREIVVPNALPSVITGLRVSMGVSWMVIVAAEMLSASSGIGFYIWQAYNGQGLTYVISAGLIIGAGGVVLDLALTSLGRLLIPTEERS